MDWSIDREIRINLTDLTIKDVSTLLAACRIASGSLTGPSNDITRESVEIMASYLGKAIKAAEWP